MSVNKPAASVVGFTAAILMLMQAGPALAYQSTAPALFGIQDVIVQYPNVSANAKNSPCDLSRGDFTGELLKELQSFNVPATSVVDAKPLRIGEARIELVSEIVPLNSDQGLDCTSWVSLTAQSEASLAIPPIETPRTVTITYWHGGLLVNSNSISHVRVIIDALAKLGRRFGEQYKIDQPPPLPTFDQPPSNAASSQTGK